MNSSWWPVDLIYFWIPWALEVTAFILAIYAIGYFIYSHISTNKKHRFFTRKKIVLLLGLIIVCSFFYFRQQNYIGLSQSNSVDYPCQRIFCLDNYFPVMIQTSKLNTSGINFDIYTAAPVNFSLRFEDTSDPYNYMSEFTHGQPIISQEYQKGEFAIDVVETYYSPAVQTDIQQYFKPPAPTPKGHLVYISGNTVSATIIGNTAIFTDYTDGSDTLTSDVARFFDSFQKTPINDVIFKPYGPLN